MHYDRKICKNAPDGSFLRCVACGLLSGFFGIFDFVLDRERLGITKSENAVFDLCLLSAFRIFDFVLDRTKSENAVFDLFLLSAFGIFDFVLDRGASA